MKPFTRKLVGAAAYLIFLGLFVEVALQTFYYATAGDFLFRRVGLAIYVPDEHAGIFNKPGLTLEHHTQEFSADYFNNAAGFRVPEPGHEYSVQKDTDVYRVMLLGPSFAYGWGVDYEETFAATLETELEAAGYGGGRDVEIINAGVPSLPPGPQLSWYKAVGQTYSPDLVVQFIYGSMAVPYDKVANAVVSDEGYLVPRNHSLGRRLRNQAKKFATVFYAWVIWTKLDSGEDEAASDDRTVLGAGREMASAQEFELSRPDVAEALRYYDDLTAAVAGSGAALQIVYFPLSYAIHAEDVSRWKHLGVTDVDAQIAFDAEFADHLNGRGIRTLNITPDLQAAADAGQRLYYWLDIHWTPEGNAVTGTAVAEHLIARPAEAPAPDVSPPPNDDANLSDRVPGDTPDAAPATVS